MPTYYVGPVAAGLADGSSWANRYGSLNNAEDTPVVAGDTVIVGPGVYREQLTCDVSGAAGNYITYIGDVSGRRTDGIGGVVRITGSDNDLVSARARGIDCGRSYRTFRGFLVDMCSEYAIWGGVDVPEMLIVEDCVIDVIAQGIAKGGYETGKLTVRRCIFTGNTSTNFYGFINVFRDAYASVEWLVENCILFGPIRGSGIITTRQGGGTVRNNLFLGCGPGALLSAFLVADGGTTLCYNNQIIGCTIGLRGVALGDITEDYNNLYNNNTNRQNCGAGANSVGYPPLFDIPTLLSGYRMQPWMLGQLSVWSQMRRFTVATVQAEDVYGRARTAVAAKQSLGAIQYQDIQRDTVTTYAGASASMEMADAGDHAMIVPVSATPTTFSVRVYREANYAGTNPQMIIRQDGQADTTITDVGAAAGWNLLTTTLTPAALPRWVTVILRSNNTAAAGNYAVYWQNLDVS